MKTKESIDIDNLLEYLMETDPDNLQDIEERFKCKIKSKTEKHNSLQYTYYYEIDFGLEEKFYVEIESGINNGTQVNHDEWGFSSMPNSRTVEVLKGVILDKNAYPDETSRRKAQAVLNANKHKFFEFERQNNYDNYVTGGNSKMKADSIISQLHVEYVYEEVEADINFI
ncbi:hypothetical protein HZP67_09925 [Elizabethkingia anophelis]|nr:hypothetical protein [Elizabethkingia anophelis]MCT4148159.1 hypothetical protein [Elizabethkingia anophelis]